MLPVSLGDRPSDSLLCLAFRISESSIGVYNEIFPTQIIPKNHFIEITNRYAHQTVSITEDAFTAELLLPDYIRYRVTPENLKEIGVKYHLSTADYSELLEKHGIDCIRIPGQDGFDVYRLTYTRESERKENF